MMNISIQSVGWECKTQMEVSSRFSPLTHKADLAQCEDSQDGQGWVPGGGI